MYAVVRRYTGSQDVFVEAAAKATARAGKGRHPSFVAYYVLVITNGLATVTVCDDQQGTRELAPRAAEWVREHMPPGSVSPEATEGEVVLSTTR